MLWCTGGVVTHSSCCEQRFSCIHIEEIHIDPTHIIKHEVLPLREDLSYENASIKILAQDVKRLQNQEIPHVKMLWGNHIDSETTWNVKITLGSLASNFFRNGKLSRTKVPKEGCCNTPSPAGTNPHFFKASSQVLQVSKFYWRS